MCRPVGLGIIRLDGTLHRSALWPVVPRPPARHVQAHYCPRTAPCASFRLGRIRLPGGGSRFVHGGATLQEIVLPVLAVNKKRKSDTRLVNVEVWPESDKITTGQARVAGLLGCPPASCGAGWSGRWWSGGRRVSRRQALTRRLKCSGDLGDCPSAWGAAPSGRSGQGCRDLPAGPWRAWPRAAGLLRCSAW